MWGFLIGIPVGVLQVLGIIKFIEVVTGSRKSKWMPFLAVADFLLLIGVFVLVALFLRAQLIWTATGMVAVMIAMTIVIYIKRMQKFRS